MKKRTPVSVLCMFLIVLTLAFIWSRSLKSVQESSEESGAVMELLRPFLELFVGKGNVTDHLVRKLAHFCEFGLLGVEVCVWVMLRLEIRVKTILPAVAAGFICAAIDENIQYFSDRGNRFTDVLLDFSGFLTGFAGLFLILTCISHGKHGRIKKQK